MAVRVTAVASGCTVSDEHNKKISESTITFTLTSQFDERYRKIECRSMFYILKQLQAFHTKLFNNRGFEDGTLQVPETKFR